MSADSEGFATQHNMNKDIVDRMFEEAREYLVEEIRSDEVSVKDMYERDNRKHGIEWWRNTLNELVREGKAVMRGAVDENNRPLNVYRLMETGSPKSEK